MRFLILYIPLIPVTSDPARYEFAKRLFLTNDVFSIENNCLTPTMKVRRNEVQRKYKAELDALYALGEPTWSALSKL